MHSVAAATRNVWAHGGGASSDILHAPRASSTRTEDTQPLQSRQARGLIKMSKPADQWPHAATKQRPHLPALTLGPSGARARRRLCRAQLGIFFSPPSKRQVCGMQPSPCQAGTALAARSARRPRYSARRRAPAPRRGPGAPTSTRRPALELGQRLLNVGPDVLHVLHAAAVAHQVVQDAVLGALLGALQVIYFYQ